MALAAGTRFGPYQVAEAIGSGGMGEVYRATDTNLKRDVAIKLLPPAFADDADRVARFQREAEALAALNHPNIAQIHGLERSDGSTAIVMELVEGPTLADRIAQGPIPYDEALGIAMQVADALEAAHGRSIVHRDLKPANIKVRPDGTVKVLDFGIATAPESPLATSGKRSPTLLTPALTEAGVLLGTAAYMSPEQARGKPVDERADIWAFGCLLYEMLTAQPAFGGEDVTTTLARVLEREANVSALPQAIPSAVRHTIKLCLEKDARRRISHPRCQTRDGRCVRGQTDRGLSHRPVWRRALAPGAALIAGVALAGLVAWNSWPVPDRPVTRFSVDLPGPLSPFEPLALSPDGRRIVYAANRQLYLQRMDQDQATAIPGAEGAGHPFFAPEGDSVAFFTTRSQLEIVGFTGESPRVVVTNLENPGIVGVWSSDGRIFFGERGPHGLSWVRATGGTPEPFAGLADYNDLDYPAILPGGEWVLFTANITAGDWSSADIVAQNIDSGERKTVLRGGYFARYVPSGHLVFARDATLFAVAFDPKRVEAAGQAVAVVQNIAADDGVSGNAQYAVASNGTLIYAPGASGDGGGPATVVLADHEGSISALSPEPRVYGPLRVSPEGSRAAVEVTGSDSRVHVWIMDLTTGAATQVTFEGSENRFPVWTPDNREIFFRSNRDEAFAIYRMSADGVGQATRVLEGSPQLVPTEVLPENILVYQDRGADGSLDILAFDLEGNAPVTPFLATPSDEGGARISPNGAWIAYVSNESGGPRIYVRPYPSTGGGQRAVSESVAVAPVWSRSGEEIYFIGLPWGSLTSVSLAITPNTLTPGRPRELFSIVDKFRFVPPVGYFSAPYDVTPNGDGVIGVQSGSSAQEDSSVATGRPRINVVLNWSEELKKLVPTD
jgi:serine/threonine-protein kinase